MPVLRNFKVKPASSGDGLYCDNAYKNGDFIFSIDVYSSGDQPIHFINHHCSPNTYIEGRNVFAVANITAESELTLDYTTYDVPSHAWEFECTCGADNCKKQISGGSKTIDKTKYVC